jgi:hypothetical protein
VIRQTHLHEVGKRSFAEALLILGLEGSRDECSTLWVFNAAIQSMEVRRRDKWATREAKACDIGKPDSRQTHVSDSAPAYATESRCL